MSVYRRLGGTRMALLILLHPIRMVRMVFQAVLEWLREEWERARGELARERTHSEGMFPFIRILSNVIVRELQTMAILLDVYLGVPVIYSTFMQYDELGSPLRAVEHSGAARSAPHRRAHPRDSPDDRQRRAGASTTSSSSPTTA